MNALRALTIVLALAILMGCAGVERKCIEEALTKNLEHSEVLDRWHAEPRVTDSCKRVSFASEADYMALNDEGFAYFRCAVGEAIDDEEYAMLLDSHMRGLRMKVRSCLQ